MRRAGVILRLLALRLFLPIATRRLPLPRLVRLVARPRTDLRAPEQQLAVRVAARLWRESDRPCLQRSLALHSELGRLGADVTLVCGVARDGETRIGHAWVEDRGTALLERGDPRSLHEPLLVFDRYGTLADGRVTTAPAAAPRATHESPPVHAPRATPRATRRQERA